MLSKDGFWRDISEAADGEGAPAPSNDAGPASPTRLQLDDLRGSCAAIERTLEAIAAPAFLADAAGAVLQANAAGRLVLSRDGVCVAASLAATLARGQPTPDWALTRLSITGGPSPVLAILRALPRHTTAREPFEAARLRWKLTARQAQVLELVARGLTNALVAETLGISEGTVEFHLTSLFDKAGVCNRATLIVSMLALTRK